MPVPTFNLSCKIWHLTLPNYAWKWIPKPTTPPDVTSPCGLMAQRKEHTYPRWTYNPLYGYNSGSIILLPFRTDVRFTYGDDGVFYASVFKLPDDREFWWAAIEWYDVRRGYPEEFRAVLAMPIPAWWGLGPYD